MYVYFRSESNLWTVGFYTPQGQWIAESDHSTAEEAANRVHWLNGSLHLQDEDCESIAEGDYHYYRTPGAVDR